MRHSVAIVILVAFVGAAGLVQEQTGGVQVELTEVISRALEKSTVIPGELKPFQVVAIHAKVMGFVEAVPVDRGSRVRKGQLLAVMAAPELEAQRAEAEARIAAVEAQRIEAEAKLAGVESTFERLTEAAKTPGVVAGNDVVLAEKAVEAERARVAALARMITAHEATLLALEETERYLQVTAPFDGVITERNVHVGTLAGPSGDESAQLFRIEQMHQLRLEAAVPEAYTESITTGREVGFSVPAYPDETFVGVVARPAYAVDPRTRTMPVELDVDNLDGRLVPGMYAEVSWPIRRTGPSLFVPGTAIKSTTEQIFVIRIRNGTAEWVDVRRGTTEGNLVEVFGDLASGDRIVLRATDEIRPGDRVQPA